MHIRVLKLLYALEILINCVCTYKEGSDVAVLKTCLIINGSMAHTLTIVESYVIETLSMVLYHYIKSTLCYLYVFTV